jgi:DNA/RNA-binding domain of Phe-tRNA-synthetase-like protein
MHFSHAREIWSDYPDLVPGVLHAEAITNAASVDLRISKFQAIAESRLATGPEGDFPEIQAWRRAFSKMGLKPTQYRCAAEALLRRFRKDKALPRIHPLIDLCNAVSLAFAIPIAVFDVSAIAGGLEVRHASGAETYLGFSGEIEHPDTGEVIFADEAGRAHARRWTHRQAAYSAVRRETAGVLIVAEALHETAAEDIGRLMAALAGEIGDAWSATPATVILNTISSRFEF